MRRRCFFVGVATWMVLTAVTGGAVAAPKDEKPSMIDLKVRELLGSADKVEVEVRALQPIEGEHQSPLDIVHKVTILKPEEYESIVKNLHLLPPNGDLGWGSGYIPVVGLVFYRRGEKIGELTTGYGSVAFHKFRGRVEGTERNFALGHESIIRLRTVIAAKKDVMNDLMQFAPNPKYLKVVPYPPNVDWSKVR